MILCRLVHSGNFWIIIPEKQHLYLRSKQINQKIAECNKIITQTVIVADFVCVLRSLTVHTGHAVVGNLEVRGEIPGARLPRVETGYGETAAAESARTHRVHFGPDICRAADMAVVAADTLAEPHATVQRRPDDRHLGPLHGGTTAAVGVERLQLTKVACR